MTHKPTDGAVPAPQPIAPTPVAPAPVPRQKTIERQGGRSEPFVRHHPRVISGICEFCGVLDRNQPSEYQYKLCPHYRGLQLQCSYCPDSKNPDEVIGHASLNIMEHPDNPDKLIVVCDSYSCSEKHLARFQRNR